MAIDLHHLPKLPTEFYELLEHLVSRIEAQDAEISALRAENTEIKRRLGMNSSNSSKPPSSDGPSKPERPNRTGGGKTRGPKDGHPGKTRTDFGTPDFTVPLPPPDACPDCGTPLDGPMIVKVTRQVAELVEKPFVVTEYQTLHTICPCCGKDVSGAEPTDILPGFSLGPRMIAFLGMLDQWGNVPSEKLTALLREGFNLPVSEGTLDNANHWLHAALQAPTAELMEILSKQPHVHIDESGWRIDGENHWLWAIATKTFTFIDVATFQRLGERLKAKMLEMLMACAEPLQGKANALRKCLLKHIDGYFEWYRHPGVPPENNMGERALRPSVVQRKIAGGNRSEWGAELTGMMQTVIGTCCKQGIGILGALRSYLLAVAHPGLSYISLVLSPASAPT